MIRTFSFGGGVQSNAALVMAVDGCLSYDVFLFCNVGENAENPDTLSYIRDVSIPFARAHGIELVELRRKRRDGTPVDLFDYAWNTPRSLPLPIHMSNGAPGRRTCTSDFKIRVVAKWLRDHGATKGDPAITSLGISADESHRARTDSGIPWQTLEYPFLDLRMTRTACMAVIENAGLAMPPKSSCYFCPFHSDRAWIALRDRRPDLLDRAEALEIRLNQKRGALGKDIVYLHRKALPLRVAIGIAEEEPWEQAGFDFCESGYCWT